MRVGLELKPHFCLKCSLIAGQKTIPMSSLGLLLLLSILTLSKNRSNMGFEQPIHIDAFLLFVVILLLFVLLLLLLLL